VSGPRTANQDFTLAFWLKFPSESSNYWHYLDLYPFGGGSNKTVLEFWTYNGSMRCYFGVPDGAGGQHLASAVLGSHGVDAWHHYAVTRKGDTVTFYCDGAPVLSDTNVNNSRSLIDSDDRLAMGWSASGVLDDVRALRKGLSPAEIGLLYNSGAGAAGPVSATAAQTHDPNGNLIGTGGERLNLNATYLHLKMDDNAASTEVKNEVGDHLHTTGANTSAISVAGKLGQGFTTGGTGRIDIYEPNLTDGRRSRRRRRRRSRSRPARRWSCSANPTS